jgi:hypothetical protein
MTLLCFTRRRAALIAAFTIALTLLAIPTSAGEATVPPAGLLPRDTLALQRSREAKAEPRVNPGR